MFDGRIFDRNVCTEPLAFAVDAVIYLWDFNGSQIVWVGFAAVRSGESGGKDSVPAAMAVRQALVKVLHAGRRQGWSAR